MRKRLRGVFVALLLILSLCATSVAVTEEGDVHHLSIDAADGADLDARVRDLVYTEDETIILYGSFDTGATFREKVMVILWEGTVVSGPITFEKGGELFCYTLGDGRVTGGVRAAEGTTLWLTDVEIEGAVIGDDVRVSVSGKETAVLPILYATTTPATGAEAVFLPEVPVAAAFGDYPALRAQKAENSIPDELRKAIMEFTGTSTVELLRAPDKNLCYSPLSLYYALLLTAGGARGTTQAELYATLGLVEAIQGGANPAEMAGTLYRNIHLDDTECALALAHAVWLHSEYQFWREYLDVAAAQYGELYRIDFTDALAGGYMARWVADKTRGLLKPAIQNTQDERLAIFNAIYCKVPWEKPFYTARKPSISRTERRSSAIFFAAT